MLDRAIREGHGDPVIGTFVSGGVTAMEILAWTGFDVLCIETEHASRDLGEITHLIRAADACGVSSLVRVQDLSEVGRVLDAGADGVVVPHVHSANDAEVSVRTVRYPPTGDRGFGPGRAARYGLGATSEIRDPYVVLMIESPEGVANAAEIAAVEGVDVVFVGPSDLAVSMGVAMGSSEHVEAIRTVLAACAAVGRRSGMFCKDAAGVEFWASEGATFFLVGGDHSFLAGAAAEGLRLARAATRDARRP